MKKSELKQLIKESVNEVMTGSDWGTPEEILADVMETLEREVEWPLTEIMDYKEVRNLLAPIRNRINQEITNREN